MIDYSVVLDSNERRRMLEDGYLPEVIDWHAKERFEKMVDDFRWKNTILKASFEAVSFFDFVADVFPGLDTFLVVTAESSYCEMDADELVDYQAERSDVYVAPASFINGYYSSAGCKDVYALVVDIDRIEPETLRAIIENGNLGGMTPLPTYIVNSGSGVHFYYVFKEPVPYYFVNRDILKTMYRNLCGITKKNILAKTDWHAITQPFRLPGSQTKIGQTVTGWKCGEKWPAKELARRLGVDGSSLDLQQRPLVSQREYKELKAQRETQPQKPKRKRAWVSSLEGKEGFYTSCLQRCYEETPEGTRYRSLLALVMVGYKVRLDKERVREDLLQLLVHYNQIGKHMSQKEVDKAMKAWNPRADRCRSKTLEEWFGWEFRRDAQRLRERREASGKKRSKSDVWKIARSTRDVLYPDGEWRNKLGAPTAELKIKQYRAEHPTSKPKDCIEATGLSKNTVYKWWKAEGGKQ